MRHERLLYTAVEDEQEQLYIQQIANERMEKQEAARREATDAVYAKQKKITGNVQGVSEQRRISITVLRWSNRGERWNSSRKKEREEQKFELKTATDTWEHQSPDSH